MIVSDAPNCGITYDHHSDDSSSIIYDHNMFIVQAFGMEWYTLTNTLAYCMSGKGLISQFKVDILIAENLDDKMINDLKINFAD
jgi:hypothetical protein